LIAGLMVLGALIFLVVKIIEARRTSRWPQVHGRIIKSGMEARYEQRIDEATSVKNVAAVEYEFSVLGKKWNGNRVNVFGDSSSADAAATLARYSVGAMVLIHYDPTNPSNCVLEQELPKDFGKGCAFSLAILAVVIGAVIFVSMNAPHWIEIYKPGPRFFFAFAASGFGLMLLTFFFGIRRISIEARSWPIVQGKIVSSGTESYNKVDDRRMRTYYTAAVEYAYSVQGANYRSRQIALSVASAGSESSAMATAARYRVGETVEVRYDPNKPENAALELGGNFHWIIFAVAILCFALAVFASGAFN
jgi:hypothetical protein